MDFQSRPLLSENKGNARDRKLIRINKNYLKIGHHSVFVLVVIVHNSLRVDREMSVLSVRHDEFDHRIAIRTWVYCFENFANTYCKQ